MEDIQPGREAVRVRRAACLSEVIVPLLPLPPSLFKAFARPDPRTIISHFLEISDGGGRREMLVDRYAARALSS